MKTYLIPIDFSDAAFNAAHFAAQLSKQTDVQDIILMNAYYISPYESLLPDANMMMMREQEIEESAAERIAQLQKLKRRLLKVTRAGVNIQVKLHRDHLVRSVVSTVNTANVDLVFIGSKGNSSVGQAGIGSHVIEVSKTSPAPVIVVPPQYRYQLIDKAVLACDFKQVKQNIPLQVLHKLFGSQQIKLVVVHIDQQGKHAGADAGQLAEETALHGVLKSFNPAYHFVNKPDVIKGILDFAEEQDANMVIALPHRYSFLQSLLHSSISLQLASNAAVPVLLLK